MQSLTGDKSLHFEQCKHSTMSAIVRVAFCNASVMGKCNSDHAALKKVYFGPSTNSLQKKPFNAKYLEDGIKLQGRIEQFE